MSGHEPAVSAGNVAEVGTAEAFAGITALEQQVDKHLTRPHVTAAASQPLLLAATRWSAAVWRAAEACGPVEVDAVEVSRGLAVVRRPVFVCGAHRSGTTLVRDLLDDHPALAVLPSEGTFFTNFERHLHRQRREYWLPYMGCEWLRRLANPIHRQPYWLLGRSSQESSAYVGFARALMAWWPLAQEGLGRVASSWPLAAVALAYAHCTGRLTAGSILQCWSEKTPTNERFLDRLRAEFPQAKFVHVVRHPFAVYASHKEAAHRAGERLGNAAAVLRDLGLSYRVAAAQSRQGCEDYLLIRYEELIESVRGTADRLAAFARIESLASLMHPSAAGLPTSSNSSFPVDEVPGWVQPLAPRSWADTLTRSERRRVVAAVGDAAARLGYELTPVAPWRARLSRCGTRIMGRLT